jgi:hypothetical protein
VPIYRVGFRAGAERSLHLDLIKQVEQAAAEIAPGKRIVKTAKHRRFAATRGA